MSFYRASTNSLLVIFKYQTKFLFYFFALKGHFEFIEAVQQFLPPGYKHVDQVTKPATVSMTKSSLSQSMSEQQVANKTPSVHTQIQATPIIEVSNNYKNL